MIDTGSRVEQLTSVPFEKVEEIAAMYRAEGATRVSREQQPDGSWIVTAEFSPEPVGKAG
ncbi:MAG: hypothetical protein IH903_03335 [Proteobacteria bacterium]|nr:hypothetical protein [Pseudomonadota bacterium]